MNAEIIRFPEFKRMLEITFPQVPLQRKRIESFLLTADERYWQFAESLSAVIRRSVAEGNDGQTEAAKAYRQICAELLREQIRFRKSGVYQQRDNKSAVHEVYEQKELMRRYLKGLLLTYLFWPNHYQIFFFFQKHLAGLDKGNYLEVGSGHGLFAAEVLKRVPQAELLSIDISEAAIEMTGEMLKAFGVDRHKFRAMRRDFLANGSEKEEFDFIIMGEVLEHVSEAPQFLAKAKRLLKPGGTIFLSTCVNAPAIDHVYNFNSVDEIRELVAKTYLVEVKSLVLPAEDTSPEKWREELTPLNYAAILQHK